MAGTAGVRPGAFQPYRIVPLVPPEHPPAETPPQLPHFAQEKIKLLRRQPLEERDIFLELVAFFHRIDSTTGSPSGKAEMVPHAGFG